MRSAGNALRAVGLRRAEVLQIARRYPPVLGKDGRSLITTVSFLKYNCGVSKVR